MMHLNFIHLNKPALVLACLLPLAACNPGNEHKQFEVKTATETGLHFANKITETEDWNIFNYMYLYNGGGVGAGDFNNDGLVDLYFVSNMEDNQLFLNEGNLKFKNVTDAAGVKGESGWKTGVSVVDINADGLLDIYVGYLGEFMKYRGKNLLFVNQGNNEAGIPVFDEQSAEFGLNLVGFSTQAAFLDYDRDGDLDMYQLFHSVHDNGTFGRRESLLHQPHKLSGDRLLRNDNGFFVDVSAASGIYSSVLGYGLGIAVSDVNGDDLPDIYVGNDFHENDYLYINQGDGTFKESIDAYVAHTSRFTMGLDIADINNDALPDIFCADMLPYQREILKASAGEEAFDTYHLKKSLGYNEQYARNTLQLNRGDGRFSEIAQQMGVDATDWSWSPLLEDFNNDGFKDLFVSNGIYRRPNDLDYIKFISHEAIQSKISNHLIKSEDLMLIDKMPRIKLGNRFFQNNGNLSFTDQSAAWAGDVPTYSNGAITADLDNDGDYDIVVNNIEDEVLLYENKTDKQATQNYVKFKLAGSGKNTYAVGAKISVYAGNSVFTKENFPVKGFESSALADLCIGIGANATVDSATIRWPEGNTCVLKNVAVNALTQVKQADCAGNPAGKKQAVAENYFADVTNQIPTTFRHEENELFEFGREPFLLRMNSTLGPALAVGDINGDNRDDLFIGGAKWKTSQLFEQRPDGSFVQTQKELFKKDSIAEDNDALFLDFDRDGDQDLLVLPGGNEFSGNANALKLRLYLNQEHVFSLAPESVLPNVYITGAKIAAGDYDGDGDTDLFLAARSTPGLYTQKPTHYFLQNTGTAFRLLDVPALKSLGRITDAVWADMNADKRPDLVVSEDWGAVKIMLNKTSGFELLKDITLDAAKGLWNCVKVVDIDGDGDQDIIAGNFGLNSKLHPSEKEPVRLHACDVDANGHEDMIISYYLNGVEIPFATKDELAAKIPAIKKGNLSYQQFARETAPQLFTKCWSADPQGETLTQLATVVFENKGGLKFELQQLPAAAQFSGTHAIECMDINRDGRLDILLLGNFYENTLQIGRLDANLGCILLNKGNNSFEAVIDNRKGFVVDGQVRKTAQFNWKGENLLLLARNNDTFRFIRLNAAKIQ